MATLPRAILFDLDDTLIRAYAQPEEAWTRLLHFFAMAALVIVPLATAVIPSGTVIENVHVALSLGWSSHGIQ